MQGLRQVDSQIDPGILLNWVCGESFNSRFHSELDWLSRLLETALELDEPSLRRAEARWLTSRWPRRNQDHALKNIGSLDQKRYITDDFGRLIQEMLQEKHIIKVHLTDTSNALQIAVKAWPVGFCIYVVMMRLCQAATGSDLAGEDDFPAVVLDPTTWHSIHENIIEDITTGRPFLAYLLDMTPVWHDWNTKTDDNGHDL